MVKCAMVWCGSDQYVNGKPNPFCPPHYAEFKQAPEGLNLRPTSASDYRDRMWKERCIEATAKRIEAALAEVKKA